MLHTIQVFSQAHFFVNFMGTENVELMTPANRSRRIPAVTLCMGASSIWIRRGSPGNPSRSSKHPHGKDQEWKDRDGRFDGVYRNCLPVSLHRSPKHARSTQRCELAVEWCRRVSPDPCVRRMQLSPS